MISLAASKNDQTSTRYFTAAVAPNLESARNQHHPPQKHHRFNILNNPPGHTFFLSLIEPFPRTIILQPVSLSNCLAVIPRGPRIRPTKLNYKHKRANTQTCTQTIT